MIGQMDAMQGEMGNGGECGQPAENAPQVPGQQPATYPGQAAAKRDHSVVAWVLIGIGALFLMGEIGHIWWWSMSHLWPVALVAVGVG